jgi:hypothetical protein
LIRKAAKGDCAAAVIDRMNSTGIAVIPVLFRQIG